MSTALQVTEGGTDGALSALSGFALRRGVTPATSELALADKDALLPDSREPATNYSGSLSFDQKRDFHNRIAMIGDGAYGSAIRSRFPEGMIRTWSRGAELIQEPLTNPVLPSNFVTSDMNAAIEGRGVLFITVPSFAFPDVLPRINPHPGTVVVSFAKGLLVPGWDPLASEDSLMKGPPANARALTPLEFIASHPNWKNVTGLVAAAGPGFARDVASGGHLGITLASRDAEGLARSFYHFSGMTGDKTVELYDDPTAIELASAMKNVAAFAAGIVYGILKKHGALEGDKVTKRIQIPYGDQKVVFDDKSILRLANFASKESVNIVKAEDGGKGALLTMAGNFDLHLTTGSFQSRNVQAGIRLAMGENLYEILTKKDEHGHRLTAEGVIATHAMACRIQNNNMAREAYAPLVFAVRDILLGRGTAEQIMANYFLATNAWAKKDAERMIKGSGTPFGVRFHEPAQSALN